MNEQDTQTVERVAKAINGPHDSSHIGIEELHKLQDYLWKRHTTKAERHQILNQASAAIAAMPDTTAQADTVTPQQAAKVLIGSLGLKGIREAHEGGDGCPRSSSLAFAERTYRTLRAIAGKDAK